MPWSVDARVGVGFGAWAAGDALLVEGGREVTGAVVERFEVGHPAGCGCCLPRSSAAIALDRLFQRRARGEVGFFRRVVAITETAEGDMAVWAALRDDPVVSARFRFEEDQSGMSASARPSARCM